MLQASFVVTNNELESKYLLFKSSEKKLNPLKYKLLIFRFSDHLLKGINRDRSDENPGNRKSVVV